MGVGALCGVVVVLTVTGRLRRLGYCAVASSGGPAVDGDVAREHYARLAATYDENYAYSPAFVEWMTGCILRRLRLASGDWAADIGCGTGLYARGLAGQAAAVVCVDASEAMLAQVPASKKLITVAAPAEGGGDPGGSSGGGAFFPGPVCVRAGDRVMSVERATVPVEQYMTSRPSRVTGASRWQRGTRSPPGRVRDRTLHRIWRTRRTSAPATSREGLMTRAAAR